MKLRMTATGWLAIYAVITPLALGTLATWDRLRTLPEAAGWAQAIGSVLAILAGFGGILMQARFQHEASARLESRQWDKVDELTLLAQEVAEKVNEAMRGVPVTEIKGLRANEGELKRLFQAMQTVPPLSLPSAKAISTFAKLQLATEVLVEAIHRFEERAKTESSRDNVRDLCIRGTETVARLARTYRTTPRPS